ncbi:DUF6457 domain-containing protein [Streptomyces sp. WMMB303]|uniref:DUF6457 domain-containing protein n=1 Tax=Streptomyces sp. WMMB303 TaxID=3034154 RepID=UPI0023EC44C6|nr:DUF6457 domain-containing protein [Streptomyces sp. WMMB303]MDF4251785.1 DUF6457 domain-containing protein [Streptomyces sp. WMMB303]
MRPAPDSAGRPYTALVLAGGGARRLGGADKPAVTVGGRTLLDRVLAACGDATATVVVGPRRPTCRPVLWAREEPPGGGPLAALQAGLDALAAAPDARAGARTGSGAGRTGPGHGAAGGRPGDGMPGAEGPVLVVSADLPFLSPSAVRTLVSVPDGTEAAVGHDGRDQPLLAAYRVDPLRRELALLRTEYGSLTGLPLRMVLQGLMLHRVTAPSVTAAALDCDTWGDIATARARIREHESVLDEWISAVKTELGIELDVDTSALLALARDAAHGVARPAAPLTTFLVGYAAARAGGSPQDVARAAEAAARLARRWADESGGDTPGADGSGNTPGPPATDGPGSPSEQTDGR